MTKIALALLIFSLFNPSDMDLMYTFSKDKSIKDWRIVNDGVMGGISESSLRLSEDGHGQFSGHVSLANYGGFASVQLNLTKSIPEGKKFIVLRVKGDGKRYEFRLKGELAQYEQYVHSFSTSGEWETIKLDISEFYPQFRGRKLNMPNFNFEKIEQVSFLIANKKEEDFSLLIDAIGLE